ncbi:MAG: quinolinate synthase NadA [Candidatus Kapabacteria bacterium]|nr:quinolinate synthase NadA [Ignavibacteriota bacterium]MCW5884282.1 quinolinate synthase NadA [Candidatus Kapabacteria bacterium]
MEKLTDKLIRLKKERNAVILAHYYQDPTIQDVADFMGDSLALAQAAKVTKADVILFCGVHFMAETAKILNPDKIVIVPDMDAGCSLADSAPADKFRRWVDEHKEHTVVSYINCTAEVKAMSDLICTSSNAEKIIASIPKDTPICFAPDKYLGRYIAKKTGRDMIIWDGSCQVHEIFSETEVINLMNKYPEATVLAHPECPENILAYADFIGSTTNIINEAVMNPARQFIILTEPGVIHQMKKAAPEKEFIPVGSIGGCACNECPHMRLNTIEKMINALENLEPQIHMRKDLIEKALVPLERMLELSK